jgi:hypothetical protein
VKIDEEGNVLGIRKGAKRDGEFVVVSAHMDTVFPAGSRRDTGNRLPSPAQGRKHRTAYGARRTLVEPLTPLAGPPLHATIGHGHTATTSTSSTAHALA